MRNFAKLIKAMRIIAIIAFAAIIGLSMMSCDWLFEPSPNPNPCANHTQAAITITGLEEYNGEYAMVFLGTGNTNKFKGGWGSINNGSVKIYLLCLTCDNLGFTPGNYWVDLIIEDFDDELLFEGIATTRNISSGNNNMAFSLFKAPDPDPDPETGTLTITGLDAYNGWYIFGDADPLYAAYDIGVSPMMGQLIFYGVQIVNGSVTLPVWEVGGPHFDDESFDYYIDKTGYDGNDKVTFYLSIWDEYGGAQYSHMNYSEFGTVTVTFVDGIATGVFVGEGEFGLTITGLGDYIGYNIVAFPWIEEMGDIDNIVAGRGVSLEGTSIPIISEEIWVDYITLPVWDVTIEGSPMDGFDFISTPYTGNDTLTLVIYIWEDDSYYPRFYTSVAHQYYEDQRGYGRIEVTFVNGIASVEFVEYDFDD